MGNVKVMLKVKISCLTMHCMNFSKFLFVQSFLKFSRKHDQYKAENVYIFVDAEEIKATHM